MPTLRPSLVLSVGGMIYLLTILLPSAGWSAAGTEGASFLEIPTGAGPAAMGSAYSALATDAYAPTWNPGGLGFVQSLQVATQYLSYLQTMNDEFVSAVYPLAIGKALGFSAQYLGTGQIPETEVGGASSGNFSSDYGVYALAYGQMLTDRLSLGFSAKLVNAQISDVSANAYAVDFGSLYKFDNHFTLAATLTNLGTKLSFINEGDSLPLEFHMAGAYQLNSQWLITMEGIYPQAGPASFRIGGQWRPLEAVSLRAGYRTDNLQQLSPLAGFSTGIGIHVWGQELAYAWVPLGALGDTQYISLVFKFGQNAGQGNLSPPPPPRPASPAVPPRSLETGAPEAPRW